MIDKLIDRIIRTKNPIVVGLDPDFRKIPQCYRALTDKPKNSFEAVSDILEIWGRDVIDSAIDIIPAVKPQIAFYEKFGSYGLAAFEKTVRYAKSKGLVVIEDGKRNDIGNTAAAYAEGHLGMVELPDGTQHSSIDVDFLTVSPFLGSESLTPFIQVCEKYRKGIFVLVKTSNSGSGEIQDVIMENKSTISEHLAEYVAEQSTHCIGRHGYSSIGAVVGATYPKEAMKLRALMPQSYFLVPGYGAQGGDAKSVVPCFHPNGLGAIVNSSRGVLYEHSTEEELMSCTKEEYLKRVRYAVVKMQKQIYSTLKENCAEMIY